MRMVITFLVKENPKSVDVIPFVESYHVPDSEAKDPNSYNFESHIRGKLQESLSYFFQRGQIVVSHTVSFIP